MHVRFAARGAAAVVCGGGVIGLTAYKVDEGFRRAVQFNRDVLPIALHYKAVELLSSRWESRDASNAFKTLHATYAPISLDIVLRQKGFYVKTAQFLSQYPDVIPDEYVEAFKILRDQAPSLPFDHVQTTIERELGLPLEKVFKHIDIEPIGAASIGQVHAATLVDGTSVVVKVQYPDAERMFYIDIELSMRLCNVLAPYYVDILRQLQKSFGNEFDYRREAKLQREARSNLKKYRDIVVPAPFDDEHPKCLALFGRGLVTKHVFVMERLHGKPVDKWANEAVSAMAAKEGVTADDFLKRLRSLSPSELQRLMPSESAVRAHIAFLGAKDALRNGAAWTYNWTLGCFSPPLPYARSARPLNVYSLVDRIFGVQARCIFEDGFFNGDPHAGNVLLLDDGRLGLIDWGQVGRLSPEQRVHFSKAIIAVAARDEPLIAKFAWEMGIETEKHIDWVAMKLGTFWLGSFGDDVVKELGGATSFELNLARIDRLVTTAEDYFFAVRCVMMTRGVAALIGFPAADSAVRMRPAAEACLARAGVHLDVVPGRKLPRPDVEALTGLPPMEK